MCGTEFSFYACTFPKRQFCSKRCQHTHQHRAATGSVWRGKNGYLYFQIHGKKMLLHRLVAGAKPGEVVHHRDGDQVNNGHDNLEILPGGQSEHIRLHNPIVSRWRKYHEARSR